MNAARTGSYAVDAKNDGPVSGRDMHPRHATTGHAECAATATVVEPISRAAVGDTSSDPRTISRAWWLSSVRTISARSSYRVVNMGSALNSARTSSSTDLRIASADSRCSVIAAARMAAAASVRRWPASGVPWTICSDAENLSATAAAQRAAAIASSSR